MSGERGPELEFRPAPIEPIPATVLDLKPGDVLCFRVPRPITEYALDAFKHQVKNGLPEGIRVMILVGDVELTVVHPKARPSTAGDAP